jgi:hypothetical protein
MFGVFTAIQRKDFFKVIIESGFVKVTAAANGNSALPKKLQKQDCFDWLNLLY